MNVAMKLTEETTQLAQISEVLYFASSVAVFLEAMNEKVMDRTLVKDTKQLDAMMAVLCAATAKMGDQAQKLHQIADKQYLDAAFADQAGTEQ